MSSRRIDRINGLLRQEISELLFREIKDPRLDGVISITQVKTSSDLRSARVYVSVLGDQAAKQNAMEGIQSAAAFLRRELRERLSLRHVPFMKFVLDESIEDADHLLRIMDRIRDNQQKEAPQNGDNTYQGPLSFSPNHH
jgi:ribosome-binding factor A